ncbi:MAG: response regulator transcription factor [Dorea sp.]|nr:response regulator transcription factor [Dorea sp.]
MDSAIQNTFQVLVVDDNPEIREIIQILLTNEGYQVTEAASGSKALEQLSQASFDLIILDIMMPGPNGYQTCLEIRKITNAPILFLSARTKDSDKMLGFSSGGDDFLAKPFSYSELVWRVKALIRRYHIYRGVSENEVPAQRAPSALIRCHGLEINTETEEVRQNGQLLELTDTEYALLKLLTANRHQIFSAEHLYERIWDEPYYYGANNTIMVHIRNLRRKIEKDPKNPVLIKTIWGKGYRCD